MGPRDKSYKSTVAHIQGLSEEPWRPEGAHTKDITLQLHLFI